MSDPPTTDPMLASPGDSPRGPMHPTADNRQPARPESARLFQPQPAPSGERPGDQIGPYALQGVIGEGGFGVVFRAEQGAPVRRLVALKIIKPGMDSRAVIARFEAERQALAVMDHPCIARVFDAGSTPLGRPYFVMEFVRGEPITEFCDRHRMDIAQRLRLFIRVCEAVQHAHMKGVIHRDIKPSNILVTVDGEQPLPKVIDFGVAKALNTQLTDHTLLTMRGEMIGTPEYMSPEQAEMSTLDIDTRSDVYSLGVVLYQLLTGSLPFDSQSLRRAGMAEVQRMIREVDPPKPSTRVSSLSAPGASAERGPSTEDRSFDHIAQQRRTDIRSLARQLRADLDWIVMKCLDKDRTRRYDTANGLAMDLRRYLEHEPVHAGPPSAAYRLSKLVRRHRAAVIAASIILLAFIAGTIGTSLGLIEARRQRDDAVKARMNELDQRHALEQREAELLKVTQFQASMLTGLDAHRMGLGLMDSIRAEIRRSMAARGESVESITERLRALDETVNGVNVANVAVNNIDENILDRAEQAIRAQFAGQPQVMATLLQRVADTLMDLGLNERALVPQRDALELRTRELGADHSDTLDSAHGLGTLLHHLGKLEEAQAILRDTLERSRRVLGDEHQHTLDTLNNHGGVLNDLGRYAEAETSYREAHVRLNRTLGADHRHTLVAQSNVAALVQLQGRVSEAETLHREVLAHRRRILGELDDDTLSSMLNLAILLKDAGRHEESLPLLRQVAERRSQRLGDDHPSTISAVLTLGQALHSAGKTADSEPILRESLSRSKRVLGDEHPNAHLAIYELATLLLTQGEYAEAEGMLREVLRFDRRALGDDHPRTLSAMTTLAGILHKQSKRDEAEALLKDAIARWRRIHGDRHPETLHALSTLGVVLLESRRLDESEAALREALDGMTAVLGPDDPNTMNTLQTLAGVFRYQRRFDDAERCCRDVLERRRRVLGDDHPDTLSSYHLLAFMHDGAGQLEDAAREYRDAYERRSRALGLNHPDTLVSINNLSLVLAGLGRYDEAEMAAQTAWEGYRVSLGEEDPATLDTHQHVGLMLRAQKRHVEAERVFRELLEKRRTTNGDDDVKTLEALYFLGTSIHAQDRFDEAEPPLRTAYEQRGQMLGPKAAGTVMSQMSLGAVLRDLGRFAEAEPLAIGAATTAAVEAGPSSPATQACINNVIKLYEAWHAAEPEAGHEIRAVEWRAKTAEQTPTTAPK